MRGSSGFRATKTTAQSAHRGVVAVFYRKVEHFAIEELRLHGPNVISFQLFTRRHKLHIVGCYIAPSNALTIEGVVSTMRSQPCGYELLVAGDLNANLEEP